MIVYVKHFLFSVLALGDQWCTSLSVLTGLFALFIRQERGVSVLTKALEQCLAVRMGEGYEVLSDNATPPISKEMSQEVIEILKTLFNIAHRFYRQEPDEVTAQKRTQISHATHKTLTKTSFKTPHP